MPVDPKILEQIAEDVSRRRQEVDERYYSDSPNEVDPSVGYRAAAQRQELLSDPDITSIRPYSTGRGSSSIIYYKDGSSKIVDTGDGGAYLYYNSPDLIGIEQLEDASSIFKYADGTEIEGLDTRSDDASSNFFESMNWAPTTAAAILAAVATYASGGLAGIGLGAAEGAGAGTAAELGGLQLATTGTGYGAGAGLTAAEVAALEAAGINASTLVGSGLTASELAELYALNPSSVVGTTPADLAALEAAGYTGLAEEGAKIASTVGSIGNQGSNWYDKILNQGKKTAISQGSKLLKTLTGGATKLPNIFGEGSEEESPGGYKGKYESETKFITPQVSPISWEQYKPTLPWQTDQAILARALGGKPTSSTTPDTQYAKIIQSLMAGR